MVAHVKVTDAAWKHLNEPKALVPSCILDVGVADIEQEVDRWELRQDINEFLRICESLCPGKHVFETEAQFQIVSFFYNNLKALQDMHLGQLGDKSA